MLGRISLRYLDGATRRWRHVVRSLCLLALVVFAAPGRAAAEIIYVSSFNVVQGDSRIHRFDSEAPSVVLESFEVDLPLPFSVEFDEASGELYAFEHYECGIATCPSPSFDVARIDPLTGDSTILDTSGLSAYPFRDIEADIHPLSREIRYLTGGTNARIPLSTLVIQFDSDLNIPAYVYAVAYAPAAGGASGIEMFAIAAIPSRGGSWYKLIRVGGPGGVPPASSGEVTILGDVDVIGFARGFDVSTSGTAYLATEWDYDAPDGYHVENRLYTIDLATGAPEEVGFIAMPLPYSFVNGLSVAPPGVAAGVLAVPSLSQVGIAALTILLAGAALRRLRFKYDE